MRQPPAISDGDSWIRIEMELELELAVRGGAALFGVYCTRRDLAGVLGTTLGINCNYACHRGGQ